MAECSPRLGVERERDQKECEKKRRGRREWQQQQWQKPARTPAIMLSKMGCTTTTRLTTLCDGEQQSLDTRRRPATGIYSELGHWTCERSGGFHR